VPRSDIERQFVASHVRSLLADHLTDVASADRHSVKPWFAGKLDFAPPVIDLARDGFPLVGGRLDYIDGRVVAALVYRRQNHLINLFIAPGAGTAPTSTVQDGYQVMRWSSRGLSYASVSDLDATSAGEFRRLFEARSAD